jgi:tetratricopeptide (TPR) repeat protein
MKFTKMITFVAMAAMLSAALGCESQHTQNRKDAMGRWNTVRLRMAMDVAEEQLQSGQSAAALETAQGALATDAEYAPAMVMLGRAWLAEDKPGRAKSIFEACVAMDSTNAEANYYLGNIYARWEDLEQALTHYSEALELAGDNVDYAYATVDTLVRLGRTDAGLDVLAEYAKGNGPDEKLLGLAGKIFAANGDYEEAVLRFRRALRVGGANAGLSESLALALFQAGRAREAVNLFEELLASDGDGPSWRYDAVRGECYMQLEEYHEAQRCLESASQHKSDNAVVWVRLGQLALRRGNLERAGQCAERAGSLDYEQDDLQMLRGCVALKRGQWDKSEAIFRQMIAADDKNGLAYCLLGKSLQQKDGEAEALVCYREALSLDGDDALAMHLLKSLE